MLTVVGIYLVGRRVVRPFLVAVDKQPDTFTAHPATARAWRRADLDLAGLSMALGALLGLIIAETEFRHGWRSPSSPSGPADGPVLHVGVGAGHRPARRAARRAPVDSCSPVVGLLAMKALIVFVLLRVFPGCPGDARPRAACCSAKAASSPSS